MSDHQLLIRNARLVGDERLHSIVVRDGVTQEVAAGELTGAAEVEIDAEGHLVTASFVNGHMHLCKPYTYDEANTTALDAYSASGMGGAMASIELASAVKAGYTTELVHERALRAAREGLRHGVLTVQAFADTDSAAGSHGVDGVMQARDELADVMDIRVVAFPQDGLIKDPGAQALVTTAIEQGADIVGGIPWIELTDDEARAHVDRMLSLAATHGRRVAMLVDDSGDPTLRTLEYLAVEAERRGLRGRVTACHARAAGTFHQASFERLAHLLVRAGVGVISDPHTGPLHVRPFDLYDMGVEVGLGQDDIEDAYYPLGRHNLLEVAFLAAHLLGDLSPRRLETVLDMVTVSAARALGIHDHALSEGNQADLVVLHGRSVREALIRHEAPRYVISRGRLVAETTSSTTFHV